MWFSYQVKPLEGEALGLLEELGWANNILVHIIIFEFNTKIDMDCTNNVFGKW